MKMSIKDILQGFFRSWAASSAALTLGITGTYVMYKDKERFPRMMEAYSKGNILSPVVNNRYEVAYFRRPESEKLMKEALCPRFSNEYYLVSGEVGSGKTRLVVQVIQDMMAERTGHGAPVYVNAAQGKSFPESLAEAVNFHFDEHISFSFFIDYVLRIHNFPQRDDQHRLIRTLSAIEKSAFRYVEKYGRPVVLVIDGIDVLSRHQPAALHVLQEKAKLWADTNNVKVVFICNDERTEQELLVNASAWSRMAPPIHIRDLNDEEAMAFLTSPEFLESYFSVQEPMSEEEAEQIVQLVGGRFQHLIAFKRDHLIGIEKEVTSKELWDREREKLLAASHSPSQWRVIEQLCASPNKVIQMPRLVQDIAPADLEALLNSSVIKIERLGKGLAIRFESKLAERVSEEFE